MKKTTLLSLALACGMSVFGAQPRLQNAQPLQAKGQDAKVMMTNSRLDAIQLPGVKAQAPAKIAAQVADVIGDYEVSYVVELQGGSPYAGEMTVTAGAADNTVVLNMPFINSSNTLIWKLTGALNTEDGTITISSNQSTGFTGANCSFMHWTGEGWADITEIVATYTGTAIVFDADDAFGLQASSGGYYTLFDMIDMTKIIEDPNVDPNEGWTSMGEATFVDGWVMSMFGVNQMENAYKVELQQNDENPNIYRLVDPYHGNFPLAARNESAKAGYIQFDATDPDHVIFAQVESGFSYPDAGVTKMYCYNTLTFLASKYNMTAAQVIEAVGDEIPYTTFKNKVLTVPTGDACFGIAGDINGGYSWQDKEGNAADMFASISWPADEPSGVSPKPAVSELVDGGYYYIYDADSGNNRYGFFQDPNTTSLVRIWGDHVNIADAYGKFPEAKYIWKATQTEEGYWQFQNVGTEHYIGSGNNASATPDNCQLELVGGSTNIFHVKSLSTGNYWNADYPVNNGIALSMWMNGHDIQFYQAVSENDAWNLDADVSYTITCNFLYKGNTVASRTIQGTPGSEYTFTAPHFYSCEPVSGVITQYNLTYDVECALNLPLKTSATLEGATYQALGLHSNIQRLLAYDENADAVYGYAIANNAQPFNDNQLFALIGSFEEGVKVYNKAAGKALQMNGSGIAGTTSLVDLEEATVFHIGASDVTGDQYFALYKEGEPYLNLQNKNGNWTLLYWTAADAGSTMWAVGIAQPTINMYNAQLAQAKALNIESINELIAQAEEIISGIDPWTEIPAETAEQLEEIAARINNVVTAHQLRPYFEASYSGADMADYFVNLAAGADVEEFEAIYAEALNQAVLYMQSDMESGFVMKNKRNNRYMGYVASVDPDDEEALITEYRSGDMGLNAYWVAEFTDNGDEVANALERTFYLKNALSNTYVGTSATQSTALPCVAADYKAEDAALLKVVAGNNGFEFMIVNSGIDNNFINTDATATGALVTWNYANDGGAFWIATQLPTFDEETQPVRVAFVGEAIGYDDFASINAIEIKVPAGAALTELGHINAYVSSDDTDTTVLNGDLATVLNGAEPTEGTIEETIWNSEGEEVTVSTAADVYQIALKNVATEAGVYYVTVSTAAFQLETEEAETIYSPEFYNYAVINKAIEPFTVTVAPEAGTVDEIVNITLNSETGMAPNSNYTGEATITLKKDVETVILDLKGDDMTQYDTFSFDDLTAPYYTIPVNLTEAGTYAFVIPEGFFENDEMALNAEVTVTWTIEEKEGINSITNVTVNGQTIYDLQGRKVSKAGKGIYIINGEKTLVK